MDSCVVCMVTFVVFISLTQTIGFLTPAWFCNIVETNTPTTTFIPLLNRTVIFNAHTDETDTCDLHGLFYPGGIKDMEVFGVSITSIIGVWICTGILLFLAMRQPSGVEKYAVACVVMLVIFHICAGIAGLICTNRYDRVGWSAYMFMAVGVTIIIAIISAILYCCEQYFCPE